MLGNRFSKFELLFYSISATAICSFLLVKLQLIFLHEMFFLIWEKERRQKKRMEVITFLKDKKWRLRYSAQNILKNGTVLCTASTNVPHLQESSNECMV